MPLISPTTPTTQLLLLFLLTPLLLSDVALAALPQVDFDRMGKVGLAGSFAGFDLFNNNSVAFDPATSTVFSRNADGALTRLASTNPGGRILASCTLNDVVYFAGNFSALGSASATNIASYNPSSGAYSALGGNGPSGTVNALYCDSKANKVWVGGQFTRAVAVWDGNAQSWNAPPFTGLSGEVRSITTNTSTSSLFFAGAFGTAFAGNGSAPLNNTNNPNVPFSAGATPFSSSLVPVPLGGAQVVGSPSSTRDGFDDIENILCPTEGDGPGRTWFAADGNTAVITARAFRFISASGVRLGNTFLEGRGTTGFTVATIPDNAIQTLRYVDPASNETRTCSENCPLLTDSSIPYQDFLFDNAENITGVQVTLTQWTGLGPGLHLLQLLSSGAFASSVENQNGLSCFAPAPSNSTRTGTWNQKDANTGLPGTTENVLVSTVAVGTSAQAGPSFTWMPYVSAAGDYDVNLLVPGCIDFQDCALRTSVRITVFPGGGQQPWVTTVDQRNERDASTLIYSGPVVPTSDTFVMTVSMTLADQPVGNGENGQYMLVADRVQLILKHANVNGTTNNGGGGGSGPNGAQRGFGFFEWPLSGDATADATSTLSNSTRTALDTVGIALYGALGGNSSLTGSSSTVIAAVAHHSSGAIYLGGNFTLTSGSASGATNIVAYKNGALSGLADSGLRGAVTSLAFSGDRLFVGGAFTGSSGTQSRGVIMYDVQNDRWAALGGGVDGTVVSVAASGGRVQIAGNFTGTLSATGNGNSAGGLATWDAGNNTWINSGGFLAGGITLVSNATTAKGLTAEVQFVAGNVAAARQFGSSGFVMLSNGGDDGIPEVTPLGVQLSGISNPSTPIPTTTRRRRSHSTRSWITTRVSHLFARQSSSGPTPLPTPTAQSSGPVVYAGTFWTNSSSKHEVTIIGGNFSYVEGQARNVAIYDSESGSVKALAGAQIEGVVRALFVQGDTLYVGGTFSLEGTQANGFAVYDLARGTWASDGIQPLQPANGGAVAVRSISASESKDNTVIVAGTFAQAGQLPCNAVCALDTGSKQWNAFGSGIQGEIAGVAYSGNDQDTLVAAGSISLSDGTQANVAQFHFGNSSWTPVGSGLAGPITALEVNNGNASSIFAAGRAGSGQSFLSVWDGNSWSSIDSSFVSSSTLSSLTMVPLREDHNANGMIQQDRMLLVSGALTDPTFGNASSALFDGQNFIPYFVTTSSSGDPGAVSALIHSFTSYSFNRRHVLAVGIVILISIAIAAGIVFLLVLLGILWALFSRRRSHEDKFVDADDDDDSSNHVRPTSLLAHINAATRNTILGGQSPYGHYGGEKEAAAGALAGSTAHGHDRETDGEDGAAGYGRTDTPTDGAYGSSGDEQFRVARARYSFDGGEEGELPLSAGTEVYVLDDRDPAWWYAQDPRTGKEGVVPANYLV